MKKLWKKFNKLMKSGRLTRVCNKFHGTKK